MVGGQDSVSNTATHTATHTALIKLIGRVDFKKPADSTSSYATPPYHPHRPHLQLLDHLPFLEAPLM